MMEHIPGEIIPPTQAEEPLIVDSKNESIDVSEDNTIPSTTPTPVSRNKVITTRQSLHLSSRGDFITPQKGRSRGISLNIAVSPASPSLQQQSSYRRSVQHPNTTNNEHPHTHHERTSSITTLNESGINNDNNTNNNDNPMSPINHDSAYHSKSYNALNNIGNDAESPSTVAYDVPLPQLETLLSMDIDEQLRLLALKEMCVVEIKDHMANLQRKLGRNEEDLHKLREVIQRSLYKEIGTGGVLGAKHGSANSSANGGETDSTSSDNPRDTAAKTAKSGGRRRTISLGGNSRPASISKRNSNSQEVSQVPQISTTDTSNGQMDSNSRVSASLAAVSAAASAATASLSPERDSIKSSTGSTLWNNLSKPLNLIQQFDTMLQNEFEKSLIPARDDKRLSVDDNKRTSTETKRSSLDSVQSGASVVSSPLKGKSTTTLPEELEDDTVSEARGFLQPTSYEEKLQTVSSSIWSFVSDVRSNVLSSLGDEQDLTYNLDTGAAILPNGVNNSRWTGEQQQRSQQQQQQQHYGHRSSLHSQHSQEKREPVQRHAQRKKLHAE
ncbi:hypothetical protein CAAN1_07S06832 [[Candida] anglica]|uniref:Topoisomerase I damage affected protein 11 n=1 Tax=[Candida] anglica TaxID=148631 RepID=A0ABP0EFZ7_9ASCO